MAFLWLINGGDPNYLRYLGAHPPSKGLFSLHMAVTMIQREAKSETRPDREFILAGWLVILDFGGHGNYLTFHFS